ncbi:MAG: hypothetical protein AAF563_20790 [Pseudomonadota bacterium]
MKNSGIASVLVPLVGALLISCSPTKSYNYETLTNTEVRGVPLQVVRRTAPDGSGQPAYGILDPSNTFHRCDDPECTDQELEQAAVAYASRPAGNEGGGGGGDGGGGGGGGGM